MWSKKISDQTKILVLFLDLSEMLSELLGYTWKLKLAIRYANNIGRKMQLEDFLHLADAEGFNKLYDFKT